MKKGTEGEAKKHQEKKGLKGGGGGGGGGGSIEILLGRVLTIQETEDNIQ